MNIVQKLDNCLIDSMTRIVSLYNWTTGKTKSDLSNNLLRICPIVETIGITFSNPFIGLGYLIGSKWYNGKKMDFNIDIENKQNNSRNSGVIDGHVESDLNLLKIEGVGISTAGYCLAFVNDLPSNYYQTEIGGQIFGAGLMVRGLASLVMASENLPPRKNIFQRSLDSYQNKKLIPNLVPVD